MAIPNSNLSKTDAQWIINEYPKWIGKRIDRASIQEHLKLFNLIKGSKEGIPSCSCQWTGASKISESLYEQYKSEIEVIANGEK